MRDGRSLTGRKKRRRLDGANEERIDGRGYKGSYGVRRVGDGEERKKKGKGGERKQR